MGCMQRAAGVLWSVRERQGGGVTMATGLLRGVGTARGKGKERARGESPARVSSSVRACARTRAGGGGWGQAEYYGLSVAR